MNQIIYRKKKFRYELEPLSLCVCSFPYNISLCKTPLFDMVHVHYRQPNHINSFEKVDYVRLVIEYSAQFIIIIIIIIIIDCFV
jgi:hypothetical protein